MQTGVGDQTTNLTATGALYLLKQPLITLTTKIALRASSILEGGGGDRNTRG